MEYQQIIRFWRNICQKSVEESLLDEEWYAPNFQETTGDGTPIEELYKEFGYVFVFMNSTKCKAVRIIQKIPSNSSTHEYSMWMDKTIYGLDDTDSPIEELVFTCNGYEDRLSEESAKVFSEFFKIWLNLNTTYEEMEKIIESRT